MFNFWHLPPPTQYLLLNKNVSENDDNDGDYNFFWNKKNREEQAF